MTDVKISDMTPGSALTGSELLEMTQSGSTFSTTTGEVAFAARKWGSFCQAVDQTGSTGTPTAVLFATSIVNTHGVTMVTDGSGLTRLTFAVAGTYQVGVTLSAKNVNAAAQTITTWMRLNGTDIANSGQTSTVSKTGEGGLLTLAVNQTVAVTAGQYVQIMWLVSSTDLTLDFTAAAVGPPAIAAIPSAYVTATRVG